VSQKLNGSRDMIKPLSGLFLIHGLALAMINPPTKFEVSISSHYDDMRRDTNCRKWGGLRLLGSPKMTGIAPIDRPHTSSY